MAPTTPSTCKRGPMPESRLALSSRQLFPLASSSSQTEASPGQRRKKSNIARRNRQAASIWLQQERESHSLASGGRLTCWRLLNKLAQELGLSSRQSTCQCPNLEATPHHRTPNPSKARKAKARQTRVPPSQIAQQTLRSISKRRNSNCRRTKIGSEEPPTTNPKKHFRASRSLPRKLVTTENEQS